MTHIHSCFYSMFRKKNT